MISNNFQKYVINKRFLTFSFSLLKKKHNCPIIKINIKDLHKYQTKFYSILNKMEDNFESKLTKLGKDKVNPSNTRPKRQNNNRLKIKEEIGRQIQIRYQRGEDRPMRKGGRSHSPFNRRETQPNIQQQTSSVVKVHIKQTIA